MARTIIKTKRPFDNLLYWNEYIDFINQEFSKHEENIKWTPQVDIKIKDGGYQLKLNIPGFSLQDIKISYKNGFMTIEGNKKAFHNAGTLNDQAGNSYYDNFKSMVHFPKGIKQKQIRKVLKDSILEIQIPALKDRIEKQ